jgi:hypothetical protein
MAVDTSMLQAFTLAEQLVAVEKGIFEVSAFGTFWAINGTQITRANLPDLIAWRDKLKAEIAMESNGDAGTTVIVQFGER